METPTEAQLKDPKWWDENAPVECTHFDPEDSSWMRLLNGQWYEWDESDNGWFGPLDNDAFVLNDVAAYIQRPTTPPAPEWDGEGLPPVGCECRMTLGFAEYDRVRITYMGDGVFCYLNMRTELEYTGSLRDATLHPLRTKEQWERDQAVNAALLLDEYPSGEGSGGLMSRRAFCEALYDAGMLRKAGEK